MISKITITLALIHPILSSSTLWRNDINSNYLPFYEENDTRYNSIICSGEIEEDCINKRKGNEENSILKRLFYRLNNQNLSNKRMGMDSMFTAQCHCGITFEIKDLGSNYHPRYIYTGVCKKSICGNFQKCQPKKYTLKLLRKRDPQSEVDVESQEILPKTLQENWISEELKITVACECAPKKS